jgi:hypothetical protein
MKTDKVAGPARLEEATLAWPDQPPYGPRSCGGPEKSRRDFEWFAIDVIAGPEDRPKAAKGKEIRAFEAFSLRLRFKLRVNGR